MKSRENLVRLKQFQVNEKRRQLLQLDMMIAEFERMAGELELQITAEEKKAGITDINHFAYPDLRQGSAPAPRQSQKFAEPTSPSSVASPNHCSAKPKRSFPKQKCSNRATPRCATPRPAAAAP